MTTYAEFQDALNRLLLDFEARTGQNVDLIVLPWNDYEALQEIAKSPYYYALWPTPKLTFNGVEVTGSHLLTEPYLHPEQRP